MALNPSMAHIPTARLAAISSAKVLPTALASIVNGYICPITEEDKLVELLEAYKYKQEITIALDNGCSVTIFWGRGVQTNAPRDFKRKRYKMRSRVDIRGRSRSQDTGTMLTSLRTFPLSALLPSSQEASGHPSEMAASNFYLRCPAVTITFTAQKIVPAYRKEMAKLLSRF